MVQVKLLGAVAMSNIGLVPLQIFAVAALVTDGFWINCYCYSKSSSGTCSVEEGVTIYSTVPAVALLGFVSVFDCT
jgi:hypothetical protein